MLINHICVLIWSSLMYHIVVEGYMKAIMKVILGIAFFVFIIPYVFIKGTIMATKNVGRGKYKGTL